MKAVTTITITREIPDEYLSQVYDLIGDKKAMEDAKNMIKQAATELFVDADFEDKIEVNVRYYRDAKGRIKV